MMWMTRRSFTLTAAMFAVAHPALSRDKSGVGPPFQQESEQGTLPRLEFRLVDVFSKELLSGNGLAVFVSEQELPPSRMQALTREMRQFESIY